VQVQLRLWDRGNKRRIDHRDTGLPKPRYRSISPNPLGLAKARRLSVV
jgi:hypothetical protein